MTHYEEENEVTMNKVRNDIVMYFVKSLRNCGIAGVIFLFA
jgi:hypothetical protein